MSNGSTIASNIVTLKPITAGKYYYLQFNTAIYASKNVYCSDNILNKNSFAGFISKNKMIHCSLLL
jgi:hypothetical protein